LKKVLFSFQIFSSTTNFSRYSFVDTIFLKIKMTFVSNENLGFWILITWPFHSYTLAYYKPIHLISIEFQSIDSDFDTSPKKTFSSCLVVIILRSVQSLRLGFFQHTSGIVRYKILWLKVEKNCFIFISIIYTNKYVSKA
jgi:hypothetical protein